MSDVVYNNNIEIYRCFTMGINGKCGPKCSVYSEGSCSFAGDIVPRLRNLDEIVIHSNLYGTKIGNNFNNSNEPTNKINEYLKILFKNDLNLAKEFLKDHWYSWENIKGDKYEGVVVDIDNHTMHIFCTDLIERAI